MKVRVLGCGPSGGVPLVGGIWGNCDPNNPKNRRLRTSVLVTEKEKSFLIDTTPDLRTQLLEAETKRIDAVLYTHDHSDHVNGVDDLRSLWFTGGKQAIPIYSNHETIASLQHRLGYLFEPPEGQQRPELYPTILSPHVIATDGKPFDICGIPIQAFAQDHGYSTSVGYRFGDFAYSTDVISLDEAAFKVLEGVKVWFVDCLGYSKRPTHAHLDLTLSWIERVRPERAILIHMGLELDYAGLRARLPVGVEPGYDGMEVGPGSSPG